MRVATPSGWQMLSGTGDALTACSNGWAGAWDSRQPPGLGKASVLPTAHVTCQGCCAAVLQCDYCSKAAAAYHAAE